MKREEPNAERSCKTMQVGQIILQAIKERKILSMTKNS